jgi:hypothetical protein
MDGTWLDKKLVRLDEMTRGPTERVWWSAVYKLVLC